MTSFVSLLLPLMCHSRGCAGASVRDERYDRDGRARAAAASSNVALEARA